MEKHIRTLSKIRDIIQDAPMFALCSFTGGFIGCMIYAAFLKPQRQVVEPLPKHHRIYRDCDSVTIAWIDSTMKDYTRRLDSFFQCCDDGKPITY